MGLFGKLGGAVKNIFVRIIGDTSDLDGKARASENKVDQIDAKAEKTKFKISQVWSYANQITTMILQQVAMASEGTKRAAAAQKIIAGVSVAQQEIAIMQTLQQAAALAVVPGQRAQALVLFTIAGLMQSGLIAAQMNRIAAQQAQQEVEAYNREVQIWRNSYN